MQQKMLGNFLKFCTGTCYSNELRKYFIVDMKSLFFLL